jgi:hypothetical protein
MGSDTPETRRQFFRSAVRSLLFGTIGGLCGLLWQRNRRLDRTGQVCVNRGICCSCAAFQDCGMPQALSAKRARATES